MVYFSKFYVSISFDVCMIQIYIDLYLILFYFSCELFCKFSFVIFICVQNNIGFSRSSLMKFWRHLIMILWFTFPKGITPHSVIPLSHFRNMFNLKRYVNFSSYKYLLVQRENTKFLGDLLVMDTFIFLSVLYIF